jgi:hypothetical protein
MDSPDVRAHRDAWQTFETGGPPAAASGLVVVVVDRARTRQQQLVVWVSHATPC